MCVILHVSPKKTVAKKQLRQCYDRNHDGWGIMWAQDGVVHSVKDVSSFEDFLKHWNDVPRHCPRGIHFRIKTHGNINKENCHPFLPSQKLGIMHNGFIDTAMIDNGMSDTHNFVKYEVAPMVDGWPNFINAPEFHQLISDVTGGSRLMFMDGAGNVLRIRQSSWVKDSGIWFSNDSSILKRSYGSKVNTPKVDYSHYRNAAAYTPDADYADGDYQDMRTYNNGRNATTPETPAKQNNICCLPEKKVDETWRDRQGGRGFAVADGKETTASVQPEPNLTEQDIKSDLFAGGKTEAEGLAHLARIEEEREADLDADKQNLTRILASQGIGGPEDEEDDGVAQDDFYLKPENYFSLEDLMSMTAFELYSAVRTNPIAMTCTLKGLTDTCCQAGMVELKATELGEDSFASEEVVKTSINN